MAGTSDATQDLKISGNRLWESLMALARIGGTPAGGVNRLALTAQDRQARQQFSQWCEEAGCQICIDSIGNMFARLPGRHNELPAVMMGSHLDTQPTGGKFDGAYGVMAGLEVLRTLRDAGVHPPRALELVAWTNEEGARFAPSMMGSAVYAGLLPLNQALAVTDEDGITVAEALRQLDIMATCQDHKLPVAYVEAHIEQGPILEAKHKPIGVVSAAQGQCWFRLKVHGRAAHAGSTPMRMRADALVVAAKLVVALNDIGKSHPPGCTTAGRMVVAPNSPNVIPGSVVMTAEMRHPDDMVRRKMEAQFLDSVKTVSKESGLAIETEKVLEQSSAPFDATCIQEIRLSAERRGYPHMDIVSGAAHDAVSMSRIVPSGMIFVPCAGGVSHNELESAEPDDLAMGCQVLCDSVLALCRSDALK